MADLFHDAGFREFVDSITPAIASERALAALAASDRARYGPRCFTCTLHRPGCHDCRTAPPENQPARPHFPGRRAGAEPEETIMDQTALDRYATALNDQIRTAKLAGRVPHWFCHPAAFGVDDVWVMLNAAGVPAGLDSDTYTALMDEVGRRMAWDMTGLERADIQLLADAVTFAGPEWADQDTDTSGRVLALADRLAVILAATRDDPAEV